VDDEEDEDDKDEDDEDEDDYIEQTQFDVGGLEEMATCGVVHFLWIQCNRTGSSNFKYCTPPIVQESACKEKEN
jgi:hypothetical protein